MPSYLFGYYCGLAKGGQATKPLFGLTIKDNMIVVPNGTVPDIF